MPDDPRSDAAGGLRGPDWSPPGYECSRLLGRGGSGEVWQARRVVDGEEVALKRVRAGADDDAPTRLRREAALLAVVEHDHLLPLRGVLPQPDGVVLVLPVAAGGSVAGLLRRRGRLRPGQVVTLAAPVASALAEVHSRGLVHADVAPGNVLLDGDGRPLLADLGVARLAGLADEPASGTAGFVAPEVVAGEDPTPASDVWSLGALARAVLRGGLAGEHVVPPDGGGAGDDDGDDAGWGEDEVPPGLADALAGALDPVPWRRPSAGALAAMLLRSCPAEPLAPVAVPGAPRRARPTVDAEADDTSPGDLAAGERRTTGAHVPGGSGSPSAPARRAATSGSRPAWAAALDEALDPGPLDRLGSAVTAPPLRGVGGGSGPMTDDAAAAWPPEPRAWGVGRRGADGPDDLRAEVEGPGRRGRRDAWRPLVAAALAGLAVVAAGLLWWDPDPDLGPDAAVAADVAAVRTPAASAPPAEPAPEQETPAPPAEPEQETPAAAPEQETPAAPPEPEPPAPSAGSPPSSANPAPPATSPWRLVVQGLDEAREDAFATGDPALLDDVYALGSPALAVDAERLGRLAADGRRVEGLRHEVLAAQRLPGADGEVVLRVTDELEAHRVVAPGGAVEERPGRGPEQSVMTLRETGDGWRLVDVQGVG